MFDERRPIAAMGLIVVLSLTIGCADDDPPKADPTPTASTTGPPTPLAKSADGGRVRVVEKGFSATRSHIDGTPKISYGIMLENTSRTTVAIPTLELAFTGKSDKPLKIHPTKLVHPAPVILPGRRHGLGDVFGLIAADKAATMKIKIKKIEWWPPEGAAGVFPRVSASQVRTTRPQGRMRLKYTADSGYRERHAPLRPHAIFRNDSGKIIGGSGAEFSDNDHLKPGRSTYAFTPWDGYPENVDEGRTEVYLFVL